MKLNEIISEELSDDGESYKVLVRVQNKSAWQKSVLGILRAGGEQFMTSVRKEYYLSDNGIPSFVWVILAWGDIADAKEEIQNSLLVQEPEKHVEPNKAVPAPEPEMGGGVKRFEITARNGDTKTVVQVPLPHYRVGSKLNPEMVQKMGSKSFGATVTSLKETR